LIPIQARQLAVCSKADRHGKKRLAVKQPLIRRGNYSESDGLLGDITMEVPMGRGILLWLLGVPIPIIILLAIFWH